ncbi:MAG: hypothetical protein IKE81_03925 [Clostridia bacterium]|nr:hypothetical protein [Clostridia bacterium]
MAWGISMTGMDELIRSLDRLPKEGARIASEALYEGAGVVADSVSRAVNSIRTQPFKYAKGGAKRLPSPEEKALVVNARHGVARFRKTGVKVQTKVGYQTSGYGAITWNHAKTYGGSRTKYKQGANGRMVHASRGTGQSMKPVPLIINSINSGTSFMFRQPFMNKALGQSRSPAKAAIENGIKSRLEELQIA